MLALPQTAVEPLLAAMGIDKKNVLAVDIRFRPNEVVTVEVERAVTDEEMGIFVKQLEYYRVERVGTARIAPGCD